MKQTLNSLKVKNVLLCGIALLLVAFTACSKNETDASLPGTWKGSWTDSRGDKFSMEVSFNANNTGRVKYFSFDLPSTWQQTGGKVTFEYDEPGGHHFLHAGTVKGNKMTGTYGIYPVEDGGGKFELVKQ